MIAGITKRWSGLAIRSSGIVNRLAASRSTPALGNRMPEPEQCSRDAIRSFSANVRANAKRACSDSRPAVALSACNASRCYLAKTRSHLAASISCWLRSAKGSRSAIKNREVLRAAVLCPLDSRRRRCAIGSCARSNACSGSDGGSGGIRQIPVQD